MRREFHVVEHQGKEKAYVNALISGGFFKAKKISNRVKFALIDVDVKPGNQGRLDRMRRVHGIRKFFLYPHAARPNVVNDIWPHWEWTTAQFVVTETHAQVMKLYGYPKPVYPVGWHLCALAPFRKTPGKNVHFAPIHPRMSKIDQKTNADTFEILQELAKSGKINLTVRYIRSLEDSGLPVEQLDHVQYVEGKQDCSFDMIDKADVTVSHQTYAYQAVARGCPTIMMNENIPPKDFDREGNIYYAKNWDYYKHLLMYPLDILNTPDPLTLIQRACESDEDVKEWRHNMIGEKMFDAKEFLHRIRMHT